MRNSIFCGACRQCDRSAGGGTQRASGRERGASASHAHGANPREYLPQPAKDAGDEKCASQRQLGSSPSRLFHTLATAGPRKSEAATKGAGVRPATPHSWTAMSSSTAEANLQGWAAPGCLPPDVPRV